MNKRNRTFSDASIAESCIDVCINQTSLLKRKPCIDILSVIQVENLLNILKNEYSIINTSNILDATNLLFCNIEDEYNDAQKKTIVCELLSEMIDKTHQYELTNYVIIYRPIIQDVIPSFIDFLIKNKVKKKCCVFPIF